MKFTSAAAVVLASAAYVNAQAQCASVAAQIPACGVSCLNNAAVAVGCAATDFACQCTAQNQAAIQNKAINCVVAACGALTGLQVKSAAQAVCACVSGAPVQPMAIQVRNAGSVAPSVAPSSFISGTVGSYAPTNTATVLPSSRGSISATVATPTGSSSGAASQYRDVNAVFMGLIAAFGAAGAFMVAL